MSTTCAATGCARPPIAKGLCATHYRRQLRAAKGQSAPSSEAPVRARDLVRVAGPRVTPACAAELDAEALRRGVPVYRVAGEVLEEWARRRRR